MKKIKKVKEVVKKHETVAVEITLEEFVELASQECTNMFDELVSTGEPDVMDILLPIVCSKFTARLADRIFADDNDEESEDKE